jgi:hypothetical protein
VALLLGGALFVGFEIYVLDILGETECDDRGACAWIGDLAYGASAIIVLGVCLIAGGAIACGIPWFARRLRRGREENF